MHRTLLCSWWSPTLRIVWEGVWEGEGPDEGVSSGKPFMCTCHLVYSLCLSSLDRTHWNLHLLFWCYLSYFSKGIIKLTSQRSFYVTTLMIVTLLSSTQHILSLFCSFERRGRFFMCLPNKPYQNTLTNIAVLVLFAVKIEERWLTGKTRLLLHLNFFHFTSGSSYRIETSIIHRFFFNVTISI